MSTAPTVAQSTLHDPASRVKRKPPPVADTQKISSQQQQQQPQQPQQISQSLHKLSFSERYPDPDPTDPFAPLWVLRNRTSSALNREPLPVISLLQREPSIQDDAARQPDRRRSISYLHTFVRHVPDTQHYASDHGHSIPVKVQRTHSVDNNAHTAAKRQSFRPTPLSQVTPLALSASRNSVDHQLQNIGIVQQTYTENDSSGTESDTTRVHHSTTEINSTSRPVPQRPRAGSTNKLTRFLKTRNTSTVRASITDINRIRKVSISPPVFSTIVWAGQGQDVAPIKHNPLQQNAISTPGISDPKTPRSETLGTLYTKQAYLPDIAHVIGESPTPHPPSPSAKPSTPTQANDPIDTKTPDAPLKPPVLISRPSQTSHTDETHSTFSFVHVHTPFPHLPSSPTRVTPEPNAYQSHSSHTVSSSRCLPLRCATTPPMAPTTPAPFPFVPATLTSLATTKIKRTTSNCAPKSVTSNLGQARHPTQAVGEWDLPSLDDIMKAASLPVIAESGVRINFGALFAQQRAIVIFIRHFWCPLCQDYMSSVTSLSRHTPGILGGTSIASDAVCIDGGGEGKANDTAATSGGGCEKTVQTKLVVISNGSYTMIGKYKQIFGLDLDVYTDPSLAVYDALGMRKDPASLPQHAQVHAQHDRGHGRSKSGQALLHAHDLGGGKFDLGREKGERRCGSSGGYVKHGLMGGIAMVFVRALKVGMPVWEKGGDLNQLGGEFVLGPGIVCTYAHRMQTTKGHAPFEDVLCAAGICATPSRQKLSPKGSEKDSRKEKQQDKTSATLSLKSRNHSTRTRGQTTDAIPPHQIPLAESKRSHRRRRSVARTTSTSTGHPNTKIIASPLTTSPEREKRSFESSNSATIPAPSPSLRSHISANADLFIPRRSLDDAVATTVMTKSDEERWMEERYRSLHRLKEKKNARRGLADEYRELEIKRQVTVERSMSCPPGGERQEAERTVGMIGAMQRDMTGRNMKRDDDDIVLFGREMRQSRVNLSRNYISRKERERENLVSSPAEATLRDGGASAGERVQVEDDLETVSDKTLVHQ